MYLHFVILLPFILFIKYCNYIDSQRIFIDVKLKSWIQWALTWRWNCWDLIRVRHRNIPSSLDWEYGIFQACWVANELITTTQFCNHLLSTRINVFLFQFEAYHWGDYENMSNKNMIKSCKEDWRNIICWSACTKWTLFYSVQLMFM